MELDPAVAGLVGTPQQDITALILDQVYTPDELEVLEDEPADPERLWLVRDNLRKIGAHLTDAAAASDRHDWGAVLRAVRLIQGRAIVTRGRLEPTLGLDTATTEPPLVRLFREIGPLISDWEADNLSPDELRARIRVVRQAFDRELKALLSPPDEPPMP